MSIECEKLHSMFCAVKRFSYPFSEVEIPPDGIYVIFEKGEKGHHCNRIVRVGSHTGEGNLPHRLKEHFVNENKDRSIFRKNIGRAVLNKKLDPFIDQWEIDLTSAASKRRYLQNIDKRKLETVEKLVSKVIRDNFSFVVLPIKNKEKRLHLESEIISTVSLCTDCKPSRDWLGKWSTKAKIKDSGLWLEQHLYKTPLNNINLEYLSNLMSNIGSDQ